MTRGRTNQHLLTARGRISTYGGNSNAAAPVTRHARTLCGIRTRLHTSFSFEHCDMVFSRFVNKRERLRRISALNRRCRALARPTVTDGYWEAGKRYSLSRRTHLLLFSPTLYSAIFCRVHAISFATQHTPFSPPRWLRSLPGRVSAHAAVFVAISPAWRDTAGAHLYATTPHFAHWPRAAALPAPTSHLPTFLPTSRHTTAVDARRDASYLANVTPALLDFAPACRRTCH